MRSFHRLFARTTTADAGAPGLAPKVSDAHAEPASGAFTADLPRVALLPPGRTVVEETIVAKVLHGWLQNRHQTLFPLAVNLRVLNQAQRTTLAHIIALALLAGRPADAARSREGVARAWLASAGAEADTMSALTDALRDPPATSRAIDAVMTHDLAAYAYVGAVIAIDIEDDAGEYWLNYLALRFALPTTLIRGANRRYRERPDTSLPWR